MCEDHFLPTQFNYIEYEAASGGLSCPESAVRSSYYGVGGIPHICFDGNWDVQVGSGGGDINGQNFINMINSHLAVEAPMSVNITDFSFQSGAAFAEVTVEMFADIGSPANHMIRVAIVEDDLVYGGDTYHNTCRKMLPSATGTPLTVSAVGEVQVLNLPFTMGSWNPDKLQIIAFVQRDTDKYVVQSGNSYVVDYGAALTANGSQQAVADGGQVIFEPTTILNTGLLAETFDVSIDTGNLPEGWSGNLAYEGSDYQTFSVYLEPYATTDFNVVMNTGDVGSGRVVVNVTSQTTGEIVDSIDYVALAGGTDLLLVSDDNGAGFAWDVYGPAIAPSGKSFAIWDRGFAGISSTDLDGYEAVIWQSGVNSTTIDLDDRNALNAYLATGGNLILAGENLLESLYNEGGSARLWYQLKLRINYGSGNSGNLVINGQPGTVGDGLAFTLSGGAPDQITMLSGQEAYVTEAFQFGDGDPAGIQTEYGGYKVLTLPWGLERVPAEADRVAIIDGALDWMGLLDPLATDDVPLAGAVLRQNAPNPFNPITKISFAMANDGQAKLEIFNARGQLVRTLVNETMPAGSHTIVWNGMTDAGQQAASGTYFYKLSTDGDQITKKMSLVK